MVDPFVGEEWRPVVGCTDYSVSSLGRVRRNVANVRARPKVLRCRLDGDGYLMVGLYSNDGRRTIRVHRAVAVAFLGAPSEHQTEVNHRNGVRTDNRLANLEWSNRIHNDRHSRLVLGHHQRGDANGYAVLNDDAVRAIRADRRPEKIVGLAYGVSGGTVGLIRRRKRWAHVQDHPALAAMIEAASKGDQP